MEKPKIVILGAGYGGIITSKKLEKLLRSGEAEVTLINKHDYHYVTTQLHKIAAGTASDSKIAMNINDLIEPNKTEFIKGTVSSINTESKSVLLETGERVEYDYLLISLGFEVADFGIPGVKEHAFAIRSFRSSKIIHNHILQQLNLYKEDQDPSRLTFVVAGGGFTGVEMLGELIENLPKLCKTFDIPFAKVKIIAVEAADHLMPFFGQKSIQYTTEYLEKHQVHVMTKTKLLECTPDKIVLGDNREIPTKTLIWSCGVKANPILETSQLPLVKGKLQVDSHLRVIGTENIFCIGDCSLFMTKEQTPLPPTAQVALQQAAICAENMAAAIRGESFKPFAYQHKGSVASIGNFAAVGKVGSFTFSGLFGSFMKKVVETRYLFILGGPALILKQYFGESNKQVKVSANQ